MRNLPLEQNVSTVYRRGTMGATERLLAIKPTKKLTAEEDRETLVLGIITDILPRGWLGHSGSGSLPSKQGLPLYERPYQVGPGGVDWYFHVVFIGAGAGATA